MNFTSPYNKVQKVVRPNLTGQTTGGGPAPDPLAGLCLHTVECASHIIVLLFVHTLINQSMFQMANQSMFQMANQFSHWLAIMFLTMKMVILSSVDDVSIYV